MKKKDSRDSVYETCLKENRIFLTHGKLGEEKTKCIRYRVDKSNPDEQLKQIIQEFGENLTMEHMMTRCIMCNNTEFLICEDQEVD